MVFEGVPGGPMDCWADVKTPEQHLAKSKWIFETYLPWEAERCRKIELTDDSRNSDRLAHSRGPKARCDAAFRPESSRNGAMR